MGDWDGNGRSGIGVFRRTDGLTYLKQELTAGYANIQFNYGVNNDYPLAGYWVRVPELTGGEAAPTFQPQP